MYFQKIRIDQRLIITFVFIDILKIITAILIANSKLETCTNSSKIHSNNGNFTSSENQTEPILNCREKIIVSLAIDNSKSLDTDYIEAIITDVDSAVDYSDSKNNKNKKDLNNQDNKKKLLNPIRINIRKSPVYIEYPSIYFQTFNYRPREEVIISDVFSCEDGELAQKPTCGWTMNSKNQRIPYSQGFCCKCNFAQIIGIDNTDRNRGNTCKFLNLSSGSATAHCLKYDNLWWNAYEVNSYQIVYVIDVFISYMNSIQDVNSSTKEPNNVDANRKKYNLKKHTKIRGRIFFLNIKILNKFDSTEIQKFC